MPTDSDEKLPYLDAARPVEDRVSDLFARMTLDEKLAQLGSRWVFEILEAGTFAPAKAEALLSHGIGQITRVGGASNLAPKESAAMANTIQRFLLDHTRLGIPAMIHEESCSGYLALGATCFPQIIGAASTWEPELVEKMGAIISAQMRAVGAHHTLAPVLDVARDPRWGRVEETFGEDTYLVARMGTAYVKGLQGENLQAGVIGTGKHFVGYGVTEGGMNWAPAHVGQRELLEVFLTPFEAALKEADLGAIMNAYHEIDGVACVTSEEMFRHLLRGRLSFEGIVVSDYIAIDMIEKYHHVARDKQESATLALTAGIDIELPSTDCYGEPLRQALAAGRVDMALVDEAVSRVLRMKFALGIFERPYVDAGAAPAAFDTPADRAVARAIAQKSVVLLKNADNLLPLSTDPKRLTRMGKDLAAIAVIGPNAASKRNLMGDYSYPAHIETLARSQSDNVLGMAVPDVIQLVDQSVPMVSIYEALDKRLPAEIRVRYAQGCDVMGDSKEGFAEAVALARRSDLVILVVGDKAGLTPDCSVGEARDRAELGLPGVQEDLVRAIHETGKPIVLVLINGRPITLPWMVEHIPAIIEAWLPGEEGGNAIFDVLLGEVNPGGKLPMSFPRAAGQIPTFYNHKPSGGRSHWFGDYVDMPAAPLFPFGYGLSYTTFAFGNFKIGAPQARAGETVAIRVDVTNTGPCAGDEVVQLYVHDVVATVTRPVKELKGFKRITLQPGAKKTVTFHLAVNQLAFYDRDMAFVVEPGVIEVMVGSSSADIHCSGSFEIVGETADVSAAKVYFSAVDVR